MSGKILKNVSIKNNEAVDTSNLPSGVYVIRLENGERKIETKFVK